LGALAVATMLGVTLAGCAAIRDSQARQKVLREEMTNFTYAAPIEKVWPEAKAMFAQKGLDVIEDREDRGSGAYLFTTPWQFVRSSDSPLVERHRFVVRGVKLDGGAKIEIIRIDQNRTAGEPWTEGNSRRDIYTELELVKRVEPGRAQEISAKALAAGQEARKAE